MVDIKGNKSNAFICLYKTEVNQSPTLRLSDNKKKEKAKPVGPNTFQ